MRKIHLLSLIAAYLLTTSVKAQVTSKDREAFARKLNYAKSNRIGLNPNSPDAFQVPFGNLNIRGVDAVSSKFMRDVYPDAAPVIVEGMFTTLGLDKVVFDKFVLQVFLYGDSDKQLTSDLLRVFCGDEVLSNRIYEQYLKENKAKIKLRSEHNPYSQDIKERKFKIEQKDVQKIGTTFNIPTDSGDSSDLMDKGLTQIIFSSNLVEFYNERQGVNTDRRNWEIFISADLIKISYPYGAGKMIDKYDVLGCSYDNDKKSQKFLLKAQYNSDKIATHVLYVCWAKQRESYDVYLGSLDNKERFSFANNLIVVSKQ